MKEPTEKEYGNFVDAYHKALLPDDWKTGFYTVSGLMSGRSLKQENLDLLEKLKNHDVYQWLMRYPAFQDVTNRIIEKEIQLRADPLIGPGLLGIPLPDGKEDVRKRLVAEMNFVRDIAAMYAFYRRQKTIGGMKIANRSLKKRTANAAKELRDLLEKGSIHCYSGSGFGLLLELEQLVNDINLGVLPVFAKTNKAVERKWLSYSVWKYFRGKYQEDMKKETAKLVQIMEPEVAETKIHDYIRAWT